MENVKDLTGIDLKAKYENFCEIKEEISLREKLMMQGFLLKNNIEREVSSFEDYVNILKKCKKISAIVLSKLMADELVIRDLEILLKIENYDMPEKQLREIISILPLKFNGRISSKDLVNFIYN